MNSKLHIVFYLAIAALGSVGLLLADKTSDASAFPHVSTANSKSFPAKGWTVGFHAFRIGGYRELPVKVYGVTSAGEQGLQVAHLSSNSDQIVIGVRIKWFVGKKGSTSILSKGETPLLELRGLTGALPKFDIRVPDVTLEKVLLPIIRKGQLQGDFDVQVVVSEVKYLGGSSWQLPEPTRLVIVPLRKHHATVDLCAHQTCRLAPDLFTYQCANSNGEECENRGGSCTSLICYGSIN